MRVRTVILAAVLALVPLGAQAADLVVWWEEGFNPGEDNAVREMMADFEKKTGKAVELTFFAQDVLPERLRTALAAGEPPDFVFGTVRVGRLIPQWVQEDRLVDLSAALGPLADLIDPDALAFFVLVNDGDGRSGLYAIPMARITNHVHVWKSLLEQAGLHLSDIPKDWNGFWSFWCDRVQPAVRKATGRDDIFGIGVPMSREATSDTPANVDQFAAALTRDWPTHSGPSLVDDPIARSTLVKALTDYTAIYKKGCTPPQSVAWTNRGNNDAFLAQTVVMTINMTLSITNALRGERPVDHASNVASIDWPADIFGSSLHLSASLQGGIVFTAGRHRDVALEFVRFLVRDGWLAHWLTFAGDRYVPVLANLGDQPFWLDPGDPHRMQAVMQFATHPQNYLWWGLPSEQRRHADDYAKALAIAVHRVVADGITPEQATDEAIARVKQLLSE
jgi:multiple sugar transport system substrate-binding protein